MLQSSTLEQQKINEILYYFLSWFEHVSHNLSFSFLISGPLSYVNYQLHKICFE